MWYGVKRLTEDQNSDVHLAVEVALLHKVVCSDEELRFAKVTRSKPMVCRSEYVVVVEMSPNVCTQNVFHQLTYYAGKRHGSVISWITSGSFLEDRRDPGVLPGLR